MKTQPQKSKKKPAKKDASKLKQNLTVFSICVAVVALAYFSLQFFMQPKHNYVDVRVGESVVLNFPGRETIEMRWRLNRSRSAQLNNLDVRLIGWTYSEAQRRAKPSRTLGAERTSRFEVHAKSPGTSTLTFELAKRGSSENTDAIRTRQYVVRVVQ